MSEKKVTMRDIAKACGVSLATVSYVLNNSEKEVISHETRFKVVETARKMNYMQSKKRDKLHTKSNLVGIIINWSQSNSTSKKMIYYDLAVELQRQLSQAGYDTILSTTKYFEEQADIISKRSLDAVFIIDIKSSDAHQVTRKYYAPVIFMDCTINDPLFCRIYPNYPIIFSEAKKILNEQNPFLIMEDILNEELKQIIQANFRSQNIFVNSPKSNLQEFLAHHQSQKGIVLGDILGVETERFIDNHNLVVITSIENSNMLMPDTRTITMSNRTKAKAAVNIMEHLLRLEFDCCPGSQLLLNP